MKLIIYAMGRMFERYKGKVNWNQVVALSDKRIKTDGRMEEKTVIPPNMICKQDYDYVVVFSTSLYEEIKQELIGEYFVPKDRILPWKEIIVEEKTDMLESVRKYVLFCKDKQCRTILDGKMSVLSKYWLTKNDIGFGTEVVLDGVWSDSAIENENLYDYVYESIDECSIKYDAIFLWDTDGGNINKVEEVRQLARYILLHTRYLINGIAIKKSMEIMLQKYGAVTCISGMDGLFWIIDTECQRQKKVDLENEISIYVVTHREYELYKKQGYKALCVGGLQKRGCLNEKNGDNISFLNGKINECTALYWIWKNTSSKYVGLNHYRRFFYNNEIKSYDNCLDAEKACQILKEYDIILPSVTVLGECTVFEQIYNSINHKLCRKVYDVIRNKIGCKQPKYLKAYEAVFDSHSVFLYNLFVTRREVFERYCKWLFSFLIDAAEEVDVLGYDVYSQRVVGFFAERMWSVWLRRNKLKIKELPCVICTS